MMMNCQSYSCLVAHTCTFFGRAKKDFVIKGIIVWISLNLNVNRSSQILSGFLSFDHSSLGNKNCSQTRTVKTEKNLKKN